MADIIDGNNADDKIYRRTGFSSTVSSSFSSSTTGPAGVEWDGENVYVAENTNNRIEKHTGFSSTISSSISGQSTQTNDVSRREDGLIEASAFVDKIYLHYGLTASIKLSISSPASNVYGVVWGRASVLETNNLVSCDSTMAKNYIHGGFSSTIHSSYASGNTSTGVTWDGTNLYGQKAQATAEQHLKFTGVSASITDSYSVSTGNRGITISSRNLPATWNATTAEATADGLIPVVTGTEGTEIFTYWAYHNTRMRHRIRR